METITITKLRGKPLKKRKQSEFEVPTTISGALGTTIVAAYEDLAKFNLKNLVDLNDFILKCMILFTIVHIMYRIFL